MAPMASSNGASSSSVVILRVLVVEDYQLMRAATSARLCREPDIDVIGEASGATEALAFMEERVPDVVLLDLRLGGSSQTGVDLAREIGRRFPHVRIVAYSALPSDQQAELLSSPNVWGYVQKTDPPSSIVDAVRTVGTGTRYGPPPVA